MDGEASAAVGDVRQVDPQRLHIVLLLVLPLLVLALVRFVALVLLTLLLLLLLLLEQVEFLLAEVEAVEGFLGEEGGVDVALCTPAGVVLHAVAAAEGEHGLAAHGPAGTVVTVAAHGKILHLLVAFGTDQTGLADPLRTVEEVHEQPAAVRGPLVVLVAVAVAVVAVAGQYGAHGLGGQVHHAQGGAFLQKGHFLAIGRVGGLELFGRGGEQRLLLEHGGVEEVRFLLAADGAGVQVPASVALGGVEQGAAVRAEAHVTLLFRRVGDAARGALLHGCDEHLAAVDEGDLLAGGRHGELAHLTVHRHRSFGQVARVHGDAHLHRARLITVDGGVDGAVMTEAERAVVGDGQVAHGMVLQEGDLRWCATFNAHFMDIEAFAASHLTHAAFAEVVERSAVGAYHWIAVLALEAGELLVGAGVEVVAPHVACHRRAVVLAVLILVAFPVVEDQHVPVGGEAGAVGRCGEHLAGLSTLHRHAVELAHATGRELPVGGGIEARAGEDDRSTIGREVGGDVARAVVGEPCGRPAAAGHEVHVVVAGPVAGEGDELTVAGPHRRCLVGLGGGEGPGVTACGGHAPQIAMMAEDDGAAIGRDGGLAEP